MSDGEQHMQTIEQILQIYGTESVDETTHDDYIKLEMDGQMPLCIEKVGDNRRSSKVSTSAVNTTWSGTSSAWSVMPCST